MEQIIQREIKKVHHFSIENHIDDIAVEEPLEIRINFFQDSQQVERTLSITMRTPGDDFNLALGFLFTEGILQPINQVSDIKHCGSKNNIVRIFLRPEVTIKFKDLERHFYITSSCGVCGKTSIEALKTKNNFSENISSTGIINSEVLGSLPTLLQSSQGAFSRTGGIHASAIFSLTGTLLVTREDVGRHNALDKLIGSMFQENVIFPLEQVILLLSGRASFELIQKGAMAGISIVAALGAPSSLAIELAQAANITLIGF